jgi:tetratricopeptide (TPR) repeat protein
VSDSPHLLTKIFAGVVLFAASFWVTLMDLTIVDKWEQALGAQWVSYSNLGNVLVDEGKLDEALKAYRNSLAIAARFAEVNHSDREWQNNLSVSYAKVANVLELQGKLEEALSYFKASKILVAQASGN